MSDEIKIGQRWKEVDSRFVRIIEVVGFSDDDKVICQTVEPYTRRTTKSKKERFNGKSSGFKLISN